MLIHSFSWFSFSCLVQQKHLIIYIARFAPHKFSVEIKFYDVICLGAGVWFSCCMASMNTGLHLSCKALVIFNFDSIVHYFLSTLHSSLCNSGRYNDFAKKLNANGYKVYGMDWIGKFCACETHYYYTALA